MSIENKFERASGHLDPDRCLRGTGQCPYKIVPGTNSCPRHGANKTINKAEKEKVRMYKIELFQNRLNEFSDSNDIRSLRDDISINRVLIEEIMKSCTAPADLLARSQQLSILTMNVTKMITAWTQLEERLGLRLSLEELAEVADDIADRVSEIFVEIFGGEITNIEHAGEALGVALDNVLTTLIENDNQTAEPS